MTSLAVIGPGAIGATLAARLARQPEHRVTVAARTPFSHLEIHHEGRTLRADPAVVTDRADARPVDWVLITTKAYDADGAAGWLRGFLGDHTRVAVIQNGVEHLDRFAPWVARERMIPVMIDLPAERTAPGRVTQRAAGSMTVPDSAEGREFAQLFAGSGITVDTSADMTSALWRKLCLNSIGAVNALTLAPPRIARHDGVAALLREVVDECIAVGRAEGAVLDDGLAVQIVADARGGPGDGVNSMHADRLAGQRMEIDARNGAIVRIGARHGIPTPRNADLVALLEAIEQYGTG